MKRPPTSVPIDATVARRLDVLERLIDDEYDESPKVFEDRTGIKMAQVGQWFTGYRALREKAIKRLEEKTGKPPGWFDGYVLVDEAHRHSPAVVGVVATPIGVREPEPVYLRNNPEFPSIRRVALKAQAGVTGYAIEYMNDDGPPIVFRKNWYTSHNYQPEKMLAMRVAGESMIPSLYAGDLIVINCAQTEPLDGIAFVVAYEGEIAVKRLVRDDGQWWLSSDNQDQRRYPRKKCSEDTQIIGEVVYRQTERI